MFWNKDRKIEASIIGGMVLILMLFIPKRKIREAQVAFLFKQVITWLWGLIVVEKGLIEYPNRLFFQKANKASFTFEYFIYPGFCVLFNIYYPEKRSQIIKSLYNLFWTSLITLPEVYAVKYTNLIKYKKWTWYWSFITIFITNAISRWYYKWFFQQSTK
ncbi:CBO0543 family protein [Texcoconibacillus texcoconensis]|uniref:Uncharacterized protein n=1 Tax=Texcoconibacillus texcoconensis TaxID=1095777 RepID=A0A840QHY9_9BACI|nr:CBO0543 family protein [Texcoconibacillus texcoconensis]MBB5171954.1 hypothetical protein [Texcoconibacillus texcoconensis]